MTRTSNRGRRAGRGPGTSMRWTSLTAWGGSALAVILLVLAAGPGDPDVPRPEAQAAFLAGSSPIQALDPETGGEEPQPQGAQPVAPEASLEPVTVPGREGIPGFVYRIPGPEDEDYGDYREMLAHPEFARFNRPEKPLYYDPEWRAQVRGYREAPDHDLRLANAAESLSQLAEFVALALGEGDRDALDALRIDKDEFQLICWPEFPQSRPYLRIPADEAWSFQLASLGKGAERALRNLGGRNLEVKSISASDSREFPNFRLLEGIRFQAIDQDGGETLEVDVIAAVIECRGEYKVFRYGE